MMAILLSWRQSCPGIVIHNLKKALQKLMYCVNQMRIIYTLKPAMFYVIFKIFKVVILSIPIVVLDFRLKKPDTFNLLQTRK